MQTLALHTALRQAVEQFGIDVLTENRLVNILLDYGAYSDVPAAKTIIQSIISGGYSQKIIDLGRQKRSFLSAIFNSDDTISKPEGEYRYGLSVRRYNIRMGNSKSCGRILKQTVYDKE